MEAYRNCFYGYDIRTEILGSEGTLAISGLQQHGVTLLRSQRSSFEIVPGFLERFEDAYRLEMQAFVDCVIQGTEPSVGALDGCRALEIATAAQLSFARRRPVALERECARA